MTSVSFLLPDKSSAYLSKGFTPQRMLRMLPLIGCAFNLRLGKPCLQNISKSPKNFEQGFPPPYWHLYFFDASPLSVAVHYHFSSPVWSSLFRRLWLSGMLPASCSPQRKRLARKHIAPFLLGFAFSHTALRKLLASLSNVSKIYPEASLLCSHSSFSSLLSPVYSWLPASPNKSSLLFAFESTFLGFHFQPIG